MKSGSCCYQTRNHEVEILQGVMEEAIQDTATSVIDTIEISLKETQHCEEPNAGLFHSAMYFMQSFAT